MKNLKIAQKLMASFAIMIVMALAVGLIGIFGMNSINEADDIMYEYNVVAIDALGSIRENYATQRAIMRNYILYDAGTSQFKQAAADLADLEVKMEEHIRQYLPTLDDETDKELFDRATILYHGGFKDMKEQLYQLGAQNERNKALTLLDTTAMEIAAELTDNLQQCYSLNVAESKDAVTNNSALFRTLAGVEIAVLLLAVAVAVFLALRISALIAGPVVFMKNTLLRIGTQGNLNFSDEEYRQLEDYAACKDEVGQSIAMLLATARRLAEVGEALGAVADGDLTGELALLSQEDTMGLSLQKMVGSLGGMFGEIGAATSQVSTGSAQIADGAQTLAQGATEQAATVEELSASIAEFSEQTQHNAELASQAKALGDDIKNNAQQGSEQMSLMIQAVGEIRDSSQSIGKVIKIIDDIAFQTNILALNAAVEAARAGQHGKGFAVVADEVRNLAAKSAEAARNTSQLIESSIDKAETGAKISAETAESLTHIVEGILKSSALVEEIAQCSGQQAVSILQVSDGIEQVSQVVQQNSATAEESAASSEEMSSQASLLQQRIAQFRLRDEFSIPHLASRKAPASPPAPPRETGFAMSGGKY